MPKEGDGAGCLEDSRNMDTGNQSAGRTETSLTEEGPSTEDRGSTSQEMREEEGHKSCRP